MAKIGGFRRFGALMTAGIVAFAGLPMPRFVTPSEVSAPRSQKEQGNTAVAQVPTIAVVDLRRIGGRFDRKPDGFIWLGRAKRGNRRGRSHWDYNR